MTQQKKEILLVTFFLIIQSLIFIFAGTQKSYIHMDEAYSLGLASYDKVEIQDNDEFYDTWHSGEYYEDYLSLQEDEKGHFSQVYENQKNDVHPPLYYLLLRLGMEFDGGHFNKWPGIVINIVIYLAITSIMYLISKKVFDGQEKRNIKAIVAAFFSSITMAALTNAIYIRMYALLNMFIVLTAYLHIKLREDNKSTKTMILIAVTALLGSLTHYYYLFFLAALFILFAFCCLKDRDYKSLAKYTGSLAVAGGLSLAIFPFSIQHMFFGYRGQGFIEKLLDFKSFFGYLARYTEIIHQFVFNYTLPFIFGILLIIYLVNKGRKSAQDPKHQLMRILWIPSIFYFVIVAVASPWRELRYIMPVGGIIFLVIMYYLYIWMKSVLCEKTCNVLFAVILAVMLATPSYIKLEPQVAYTDKRDLVNKVENELNLPAIYVFDSDYNRFLDDILLFSKLDESYVAKDMEYTEENVRNVFENKDTENGVLVFINGNQEDEEILEIIKSSLSLNQFVHVKGLNACDVYYIN